MCIVAQGHVRNDALGTVTVFGDHIGCEPEAWLLLDRKDGDGKRVRTLVLLVQIVVLLQWGSFWEAQHDGHSAEVGAVQRALSVGYGELALRRGWLSSRWGNARFQTAPIKAAHSLAALQASGVRVLVGIQAGRDCVDPERGWRTTFTAPRLFVLLVLRAAHVGHIDVLTFLSVLRKEQDGTTCREA